MDKQQFDPIPIHQRNNTSAEQYSSLPDLYIKKYILCDKLNTAKIYYVPKVNIHNQTNQEIRRPLQPWGQVLNDIQKKALDLHQRKKWKIAVQYTLVKEAQSSYQALKKQKEEVYHFGVCVSHYLGKQIKKLFNESENTTPIRKYIVRMRELNQFVEENINLNYNESQKKVREYLQNNRENQNSFEYLFPEQGAYSETNYVDSKEEQRKQLKINLEGNLEFDFKKKYDNLQEVLQLFFSKEIPLKEQFEKSYTQLQYFPSSFDQIEKLTDIQYTREPCLDEEYEDLLYRAGCIPEQVLCDGERMMKRMKIFGVMSQDSNLPNEMETRDFFRYKYNYIEKGGYFGQLNGKWIPKDEQKFLAHPQQLTKQNELLRHYFIYYLQKFNSDFNQMSMALLSNTATNYQFYYNSQFCGELYAWYIFNKDIPSNSKFLIPHQYHRQEYNKIYPLQQKEIPKLIEYDKFIKQKQINLNNKIFYAKNQHQPKIQIKQNFKLIKISPPQQYQVKSSSTQPDYSMVEKVSLSSLKDQVNIILNLNGFIEKRYRNILDVVKLDSTQFDLIRKEYRKAYQRNSSTMRPSYPPPPSGLIANKPLMMPIQQQPQQQFYEQMPRQAPPPTQRPEPQIQIQPPQIPVPAQAVPVVHQPPPASSGKKTKGQQPSRITAPIAFAATVSKRRKDTKKEEQPPVDAEIEGGPRSKRSKKQQKPKNNEDGD